MTIKYLAGNRVQGTRAERFPSLKSTGVSLTGCKLYYPFNNGAVNNAIATNGFPDGLGDAVDGTYSLHSSGTITPRDGVSGNGGIEVGGATNSSAAIIDTGNTIINGTGDFTYSIWCMPRDMDKNNRNLIGNYGTGQGVTEGNEFMLGENTAHDNSVRYYHPGGTVNSSSLAVSNRWNHLACTRASGTIKLYLDGTQVATSTDSGSVDGTTMKIGGIANNSEAFIGGLAEASIWSRALSATEIGKLASTVTLVADGTIFDETDTGKSYIWKTTTKAWTEIT